MKTKLILLALIACAVPVRAADIAISALPAATNVTGSDVVPIVQSATTKKASFTVQKSLWDTYYQPLDADLTALAALSGTHTIYYRSAANTWSAVTIGTGLDFTGATLSTTGSAPSNAHYLTNQSESGLSAEINLGALSTGLLKGTVSGSISTISSVTDNSTNWDTAYTDRLKWDGGSTGLTAATGRTSLGATTVGGNFFTLTNPSSITFVRINADNSVSALDAATFRSAIGAGTGGGDFSSNTSTSVDSEIVLFSGTSGKTGKRATGTGIATLTSGVLSATSTTGSGNVVLATSPTLVTPLLGTPTSGTLTNCTGLPVASVVGDTSTALGVGSIELGHASDTTLARNAAGVLQVEGVVVPTISSTNTFTNKRNTPRVTTISSSATPTINTDNCDAVTITALATAITSMTTNLSGTPNNFDKLIIRFKDDGTGRAITWGSSFASSQSTLPTTTVASKVLTVGLLWDSVQSKWICLATDQAP